MAEPTVTESWQTIVDWLAQHAPAMHAALRGPATQADLSRAQEELPASLPDDLLEWWRLADGVRYEAIARHLIPPYYNPWQVADAVGVRMDWVEARGHASAQALADGTRDPALDPAGTQCYYGWLSTWVPIAYDGMGGLLFVDLRPGPQRGCVMEFDKVEAAWQPPAWSSIRTMLADIARGLTTGTATGPYKDRPQATTEGHLEWDV
jgi:cell wall assembly regulator SMI1